ncbi:MAG: type II toxin-antitoxin system prevent-host-death family antitoxin [Nocardioides sp.]|uniref:type II toxin-antitoxin system Phd/YefM family antitoxin n=1 Tax=Nocardioides sp. TaxID=35761 RepID=UPI0039E70C50
MTTVNIYDAKSSFSRLIAAAEAGETVVIARNGKPVAQLGPVVRRSEPRRLGDLAESPLTVADDFDSWTPQDERDWYGA